MPNFVNPTNENYVIPSKQNDDGSTCVVAPGESVTVDSESFLDWPKETKTKETKTKTEESKK